MSGEKNVEKKVLLTLFDMILHVHILIETKFYSLPSFSSVTFEGEIYSYLIVIFMQHYLLISHYYP